MTNPITASPSEKDPALTAGKPAPKTHGKQVPTFSAEVIRFLVGAVALALPVIVLVAARPYFPESISGSYYTRAHNLFVGILFALGGALFVYKGRDRGQFWFAKVGALAPLLAALCPTTCLAPLPDSICQAANNLAETNAVLAGIHGGAGVVLFITGWFFCWWPFREAAQQNAQDAGEAGETAKRRITVYWICGGVIIAFLLLTGFAKLTPHIAGWAWPVNFTYFTEWIMLWAFGFAWLVAARLIPGLSTAAERGRLLKDLVWDPFKSKAPASPSSPLP